MIASVRGRVAAVRLDSVVIEVGGVGLLLQATPGTLAELRPGQETELATSLVVREDSLTLFGFGTTDERDVFETVQTVSGIGTRLALAMLAVHTPEGLRLAVAQQDLTALTKVPGIGRKGAQRIVLELTDRLGAPSGGATVAAAKPADTGGWRDQVLDALTGLGWPAKAASDAVDKVVGAPDSPVALDENGAPPDMAQVLRAALRQLGRTG
ncbi:Holliday junction branch migration protein RuvA [Kineosporia sp. NBRC 101731]|uniref:Holliday junction branch migration protein RuvA n=1 Tax=Kineosporia sp. NBRC 101731 TaxID=3032199 RepID=UPI0024A56DB0|nr:Holliday junction branch migration protein RuvA [Kineosporia sp. NBRC 101731]GLY30557.1 Holliday junction ATP-dependent DNA helicase RuvA [Kineosporia sp. NBRC 101731]